MQAGEDVAVLAVLFAEVAPFGDGAAAQFPGGDDPDPGGAAGLFGGRDLLAHAAAGEEGFLETHAASDIQTAEPEVAHQVGGVDVLGDLPVVLEGVTGGRGDAFLPLAWVVAQVAG